MKNYIFLSFFSLILLIIGCKNTEIDNIIPNGLYLVTKVDTSVTKLSTLKANEKAVFFSELFKEYNSEDYLRIIVSATEYVPLKLGSAPKTEQQSETKKKLLLSLSYEASEKLKTFTANHINDMVVLIVDGEALTMHKIRETITSGELQISRCNDNACERLLVKLSGTE